MKNSDMKKMAAMGVKIKTVELVPGIVYHQVANKDQALEAVYAAYIRRQMGTYTLVKDGKVDPVSLQCSDVRGTVIGGRFQAREGRKPLFFISLRLEDGSEIECATTQPRDIR